MSRKDYVAAAEAIRETLEAVEQAKADSGDYRAGLAAGIKDSAQALANVFASDNSNFDRARFLAACGIN